jgi:S1-C subfamily serine protease
MKQNNLLKLIIGLLGIALLMSACSAASETPAPATATATPLPPATSTPEPTATPVPSPTPTPAPLSPTQIFDTVSPAVAFIDTIVGTGSGFLIKDGYVVTNAHVVWPFADVRITFPDGSEFMDTPVLSWDLMADIAVLGPIETELQPLEPIDGEKSVIGSDVYLIGYPGEVDDFPQPSISRGLISRLREWNREAITYFQSDAAIAGGQSGGVLVSEFGQVIGISGFSFADHEFGIIASAADIMPRVQRLIDGENLDGLRRRPFVQKDTGSTEAPIKTEQVLDNKIFVFWPEVGERVHIKLEGMPSLIFWIRDAAKNMLSLDPKTNLPFSREIEFRAAIKAPYFITVLDNWGRWAEGTLVSNVPVTVFNDPDEMRPVQLMGHTVSACLDVPGDIDVFPIELKKGQTIHVRTESVMIDPLLTIERAAVYSQDKLALDNDSGGGIFGTDAELSFTAPEDDRYILVIRDTSNWNTGGYYLTVEAFEKGQPTPIAPTPLPPSVSTDIGEMRRYTSAFKPRFSIQYPVEWRPKTASPLCSSPSVTCLGNELNGVAMMVIGDYKVTADRSLEEVAKLLFSNSIQDIGGSEQEVVTTSRGHEFLLMHIAPEDVAVDTWITLTFYKKKPVVLIFTRADVDKYAVVQKPEGLVTPANRDQAFEGGAEAFEILVRHIVESFDQPKE